MLYKKNIRTRSDKIRLVAFGDLHLGSRYCNEDKVRDAIKYIYDNKDIYMIGMGDLIDCGTRESIGTSLFDQNDIITTQIEKIYSYLKPIADEGRILGLLYGNHDFNRVFSLTGLDVVKLLSNMLGITCFGASADICIDVNGIKYIIHAAHGKSGSTTLSGQMNACMKLSEFVDSDVYLMGHFHQLASFNKPYYKYNSKNKCMSKCDKLFVLCGGYLNYEGSYADMQNLHPSNMGSPIMSLHTKEKLIKIDVL